MFGTEYLRRSMFFALIGFAGGIATLCGPQPWFALLAGLVFVAYATLAASIHGYARIGRRCVAEIDSRLAPLRASIDPMEWRSDCPTCSEYLARRDLALSEARRHARRHALSLRVPAFPIENRLWAYGLPHTPA